jgi:membrane protease YdiL (CAAX protease family)
MLLLIGVLTMHWLCYLPQADAGPSGADQVHAYLIGVTPIAIVAAITLLIASLLAPLAAPKLAPRTVDLEWRAARYAGVLVAFFLAQELAESVFAPGAGGLEATAGPASWLALPLAFALGLFAALLERSLVRAERRIIGALHQPSTPAQEPANNPGPSWLRPLATKVLAFGVARRGPPLAV